MLEKVNQNALKSKSECLKKSIRMLLCRRVNNDSL